MEGRLIGQVDSGGGGLCHLKLQENVPFEDYGVEINTGYSEVGTVLLSGAIFLLSCLSRLTLPASHRDSSRPCRPHPHDLGGLPSAF